MKKKIKKQVEKIANIPYRVTLFTIVILVFYLIGLWKFSFFDKLINGVSKNLNSGFSKVGFSIIKSPENNTRLSLS
jgi:hypothetical protein